MRVMVVGAGYVGLATAAVFSRMHHVTLVEVDQRKVKSIASGEPPFYEKEIKTLLTESISSGRLQVLEPREEYDHQDFVVLCVGTPSNQDGSVNLTYLQSAVKNVLTAFHSLVDEYLVIVLRSTVPPGTTRRTIVEPFSERYSADSFGVIFNPEFMKQGSAVDDITSPSRVVIGSNSEKALAAYRELYSSVLLKEDTKTLPMSIESAELAKYASNCFLAAKVSFANEIGSIAECLPNVDVDSVMDAVVADSRIDPSHMRPGLGFGGTCLPKDLSALIHFAKSLGVTPSLLQSVAKVNEDTSCRLMNLLTERISTLRGQKVCVLGLTFKAGTDDTRSSQSLSLIEKLDELGVDVWAHDPMADNDLLPKEIAGKIQRCSDIAKCTENAVAIFLMTDWPVYKNMGIQELVSKMKSKIFIDGRRLFARTFIPEGVEYIAFNSHA